MVRLLEHLAEVVERPDGVCVRSERPLGRAYASLVGVQPIGHGVRGRVDLRSEHGVVPSASA